MKLILGNNEAGETDKNKQDAALIDKLSRLEGLADLASHLASESEPS